MNTPAQQDLSKEYGAIAQTALRDQLLGPRLVLIIVGALTFLYNIAGLEKVSGEVEKEIRNAIIAAGPDAVFDQEELAEFRKEAIGWGFRIHVLAIVTGLVIFLMGVFLYMAPVVAVLASLVLYAGWFLFNAWFDLNTLKKDGIQQVVIILVLALATRTAFAYRKELRISQGKDVRVLPDINAAG